MLFCEIISELTELTGSKAENHQRHLQLQETALRTYPSLFFKMRQ